MWWIPSALALELFVPSQFPNLQEAVDNASTGDTIIIDDGIYRGARFNRFAQPELSRIVVRGSDDTRLEYDTTVNVATIELSNGADIRFEQLTISGIDAGRALAVSGASVTLDNVKIEDGLCDSIGGAGLRASAGASVIIIDSSFRNNHCPFGGGAGLQALSGSHITVTDTEFYQNRGAKGGAIQLRDASSGVLNGITFNGNVADEKGGAIHLLSADPTTITDSTFNLNHAVDSGGAIFSRSTSLVLTTTTFTSNDAVNGGAISSMGSGPIEISQAHFLQNTGTTGGALAIDATPVHVNNTVFCGNRANAGSALIHRTSGDVSLTNTYFTQEEGSGSNATILDIDTTLTLRNSTFYNNNITAVLPPPFHHIIAFNLFRGHGEISIDTTGSSSFTATQNLHDHAPYAGSPSPPQTNLNMNGSPVCSVGELLPYSRVAASLDQGGLFNTDLDGSPADIGHLGGMGVIPAFWSADLDGDLSLVNADCDDTDPEIHPNAPELCDGIDNNCSGLIDDDDPLLSGGTPYYQDLDGDGFGDPLLRYACLLPPSSVQNPDDCDDSNPLIHPGALEECVDAIDNDCDGLFDEADPDFVLIQTYWYHDGDGDGFGDPSNQLETCGGAAPPGFVPANLVDCNDTDPAVHPTAPELCDGVDNNCDSVIDEGIAPPDLWPDLDGDGFGDGSMSSIQSCTSPPHYAPNATDCDDTNPHINSNATEVCDGVDNNCDGLSDEALPVTDYYPDADHDGYGDPSGHPESACAPVNGKVSDHTDCDDTDPSIHPGATEIPDDLIDSDCDGAVEEPPAVSDSDSDGIPDTIDPAPNSAGSGESVQTSEPDYGFGCNTSAKPSTTRLISTLFRRRI